MKLALVLSFVGLVQYGCAQIVQNRSCNSDVQLQANFIADQFAGIWYGIQKTSLIGDDCATIDITKNAIGSGYSLTYRGVSNNVAKTYSATVTIEDGTAKFGLNLDGNGDTDIGILKTDYEGYALAYSCEDISPNQRSISVVILGREKAVTPEIEAELRATLESLLGIDIDDLEIIDNSARACSVMPMTRNEVIMQGQCNPNMPVVPNFDANRFQGLWYEVSSYYSVNSFGSCNRAQYTLVDDYVEVVNSQVLEGRLEEIKGTARVSSDDGSGKLLVTLEVVPGVFAQETLWILATDYNEWAISYSCVNVNATNRRVNSWIVSRTKTPSEASLNAVADVIAAFEDLVEENFLPSDQSEDACFYKPEPRPGVPVIFPGNCKDIPVVENFDMELFQGTWNEIEAYPKEQQQGQCIRHQFLPGTGNTLNLRSTTVYDIFRDTTGGVLSFSSTDNSAKMMITTDNGIEIPYWILATDYQNYALAYSCVNKDENYRAVYSWILSRNEQMTPQAINQINEVISEIDVLDRVYYEPIDQSTSGCSYLTDLTPGESVIVPRLCQPDIPVVKNFDAGRYLGRWNLIESYPSLFQDGECNQAQYSLLSDGSVEVLNSQVKNQTLESDTGRATVIPSDDGSAKLSVTFPNNPNPIEYWVLDTDYETYSLVYSCVDLDDQRSQVFSWKLSRSKTLPNAAVDSIKAVMNTIDVLHNRFYKKGDNSEEACFYFPDPNPVEPVVFTGRCPKSINPMPNFDAARYLGLWHDIESYPSRFQNKQCNNAFYSLGENGIVNVVNSQVVGETLATQSGTAQVISDDGSAKLLVTFILEVDGIEFANQLEYNVLDTDYETYSIVYSCLDLDDGESKQVYSWKLSRNKELTAEANEKIDEAIQNINEVDQRYFVRNDQSEPGCFYKPEPRPGVPVIFPGNCKDIPVVENFNMELFQGTWNEIEAYPKEQQQGQCIRHQFLPGTGNTLNLRSTTVYDVFRDTTGGVLSFSSTDNSAKMMITTDNGIEIPYWILATDYQNYALAYSCVNKDENYRAVYSWILSRNEQITPQAINQINEVISEIDVMDRIYLEPIDQSTSGCSYLTDLTPGESVIVPRLCQPDIPVVKNFDAGRYLGLWNLIENYPSSFQDGECNRAQYSLLSDGSVEVLNSQVKNQTLESDTGRATVIPSDDGSAKLSVTFPNNPNPIEYWVLDTDYETYSLVYSCVNLDDQRSQVLTWKLGRTTTLPSEAVDSINAVMSGIDVLNNRYYKKGDNSEKACFYKPEPRPGVPVIFPGNCKDIPVVENFNMGLFQGTWNEIEAYPKEQQQGQCIRHQFLPGTGNTLNLRSTTVYDVFRDTTGGVLSFSSTDNSAKMMITTDNGIEIPYWILATDYQNYALAYSCVNKDENYRAVYSWILSRNEQITPQAINQINEVISEIDVMDRIYLEPIDQSTSGCSYLTDLTPGESVIVPRLCQPDIPVVKNFDAGRYLGLWNLIENYPSSFQDGECNRAQYSLLSDGSVEVLNSQVKNQTLESDTGRATVIPSDDGSAKLSVTFPNNPNPIEYWVLDTDYETYSLVYSCVNLDDQRSQVLTWKLGRTTTLPSEAVDSINAVMSGIDVLNNRYYKKGDNSEKACFYKPEPRPGVPVIFPGNCKDIPVVENFNMGLFQGTWNEIEAYPKEQQQGQCIRHQFLPGTGNTLNLRSTTVYDVFRDTTGGVLSFSSTDNSAKMMITTDNGIEIPYWILATDYQNYALAYSCVNKDENYRAVYSWILSRNEQMTPQAINQINEVISEIDVMDRIYLEPIDQSTSGCSYLTDLTPGESVIVPRLCQPDIPVVKNFDAGRYLGRWRLIENYPSSFQDGECNRAQYSLLSDGSVEVLNSQVKNQTLESDTGRATVIPSDDGSAKLSVTFPNNPNPIEYWVLDTDYETYSLVYSCVNLDDQRSQVLTWKLGRTTTLPSEAVDSINAVMSGIDVLNNRYYKKGDNSEEACFYKPEPIPGVPVVYPGNCKDIPVVENFNMALFAGAWNEIEAYPKQQQKGQCIRHQFTSGASNTLNMDSSAVYITLQETTKGVLSYTNNDNSARMSLTFNSEGRDITIPFWILDTDYDNYALAYSCVNIDEDYQGVYSWKLSRTQQLFPAAQTQMDNVIENIQVLEQVYFELVDQSTEACYFLQPGDDVIVSGQCDPEVAVATEFDFARYLGKWKLVENYPSQFQTGDCNEATYSLLPDGRVQVYNTQVVNETLQSDTGMATVVPSSDGSAKLSVMFPNSPVPIDYWVLATDYDSYSLVYSCLNLDATQKRIWSWKLSRSGSLSQEEINIINSVVSRVDGLNNNYYMIGDNSDAACFYYPDIEIGPGVTIEMPGKCNATIRGQPDFDANAYLGTWYEIKRYPTRDQFGDCGTAQYSAGNGVVNVLNTQVVNEQLLTQEGFAVVASTDGTGQLDVTFIVQGLTVTANYYILATDYRSYALVYSCRDTQQNTRLVSSWKLSRTKEGLTPEAEEVMAEVISSTQGLLEDYYLQNGLSDAECFYYPEIEFGPDSIIELPTKCPPIQAQPNFNAPAYLGRWYEERRYPTGDQSGECARAEYSTESGDVVDVYNTQVVNEKLLIQTGTAVVTSTDGTGVLEVTFNVQGVIFYANYYVLVTDYENYALVYSCRDTDRDTSIVSSWVLSRQRTGLSPAAIETINDYINTTRGLREDYYLSTSQSNEDCFYVPEVDLTQDEDVMFIGQCEDITGVQNFDIQRYLGWWHEIERYPSSSQTGECTSSQIEASGNQYQVVDMSVVDLDGFSTTSTLQATSDGRLRKILSNGQVIDTWVLATDYETYSLLYSCENVNDEYRRVWSAKHSKSRQLTNAAQNAMAPFIQNNRVLRPELYRRVDQGDRACFYYPIADGRPVLLSGGCDEIIPVVQNFDAGEYSGTWYQIERYPQRFELQAECTGARYTVGEDDVKVENWEVIDGELDVITGTATISSNDGSAKLEVVLPARGEGAEGNVTSPLYVLTTDYTSYALAYSCVNVNQFQRRMGVWKLSRTREMPAAGVTAINAYMATREELDARYFIQVQHYEECLEPASGSSTVIASFVVILACIMASIFV